MLVGSITGFAIPATAASQLMEFVKYFKPKKVHPSVKPPGMNLDEVRGEVFDSITYM